MGRSALTVRVVTEPRDIAWFDGQLATQHDLGAGQAIGDYLRQGVEVQGCPAALLVWGPACYALKDRDRWISWSAAPRVQRLKLVVQNRRFLVLAPKGRSPNLASQTMGAALRALPEQWLKPFGYRPLLAESFTDPEAHAGTCYKASNWEPVSWSAGYARHRADFYVPQDRPKRLWLLERGPQARRQLRAAHVPEDCQAAWTAAPSGVLPLNAGQFGSLFDVLRTAPDPRDTNTQYRTPAVMTILALALLAGRREIAEIARFARSLTQAQRHRLNLPRKKGTRAFRKVPGSGVFFQLLTRMDPEAFADHLNGWLGSRAGTLPQALALSSSHFGSRSRQEPAKAGTPNGMGHDVAGFGVPPLGGRGSK
jgi:hypothetical protein